MFDDLLNPISEQAPSGEYLKDNRSLFRSYRNQFNMAQSSFRQLIEVPDALEDAELVEANSNHWNQLSQSCQVCLTSQSKDLEIFSWFTVAQLFTSEPLENLAAALQAMNGVIENFWGDLHPTLPEKKRKGSSEQEQAVEVIEHRIKPLVQLVGDSAESGLLYMPLQMMALVGDIDYGAFYRAEKAGSLATLKEQAVAAYRQQQSEVVQRIIALGASLAALKAIETQLADKCQEAGATSISFRFVKESIERLITALRYLVGDQFSHWPLDPEPAVQADATAETQITEQAVATQISDSTAQGSDLVATLAATTPVAENPATQTASAAGTPVLSGVATREQALANLQTIADYFLQHEPHSPIYLLLKRAIRWGGMSLPELLAELVGDNSAVQQRIEHLAGLESAEHKASLQAVGMPQAVTPIDSVQDEVKPQQITQQTTTATQTSADSGLSDIEW